MSSRAVAFTPVVLVAVALACQGNPPVHTGDGLLEFGTTRVSTVGGRQVASRTTRLSLYTAAPFDQWGYHASALTGETDGTGVPGAFDLTKFPLHASNDGTSEPFMRYTASSPFWIHRTDFSLRRGGGTTAAPVDLHNQHEILLFARDPAEQAATVRALSATPTCFGGVCGLSGDACSSDDDCTDVNIVGKSFLNTWSAEWAFGRSPLVAAMMYPPQSNLTTYVNGNSSNPPDFIAGVVPIDFWNFTPTGPGAAPDGSGSIKAVKIVNHGTCGAFEAYQHPDGSGLLQQFVNGLPQFLLSALAAAEKTPNYTCDEVDLKFLVAAPYLGMCQRV